MSETTFTREFTSLDLFDLIDFLVYEQVRLRHEIGKVRSDDLRAIYERRVIRADELIGKIRTQRTEA